jgi:primosomal protein N' (replication factor Y)
VLIADVAFDAPLPPFTYRVPEGWALAPGQRVLAPLRGAARVGVVVTLREGSDDRLKPLARVIDPAPRLSGGAADLVRWIAAQSLGSLGSTWLALLPPPTAGDDATPAPATAPASPGAGASDVLVGAGRESRLLAEIAEAGAPALVLVADLNAAARWTRRLARHGPLVALHSGVDEVERAAGWNALARGTARLAVGTRSALLAPLPPGAILALVDEHEPAHRPPGAPAIHARDVVVERAGREGLRLRLTSATPSAETWWWCHGGPARLVAGLPARWPAVLIADTRGIGRREALTPTLTRAIRETLAAGRRVFLAVSRRTSALGCDECGGILRCPDCAIALSYSPAARLLTCRLCSRTQALPETCPTCRGRRLAPFGWGAERVEHAVRKRFVKARVARYDPDAMRGRRGETQRAAAQAAEVVIGTRGALRLFGPGALGLAAFISPDQLLGLPDFRAAERAFALLWAAAERVGRDGQLVVQSQNPDHYAITAVAKQELDPFYEAELRFRKELGYPPFRRVAVVTVTGPDGAAAAELATRISGALAGDRELTAYPPLADRRGRSRRIVIKGGADLPVRLDAALRAGGADAARSRGIMDVEVDPVEWPF